MKKASKKNFTSILENIIKAYNEGDSDEKKVWVDWLNSSLNELLHNDFFGTEGQLDPRGDQRDE